MAGIGAEAAAGLSALQEQLRQRVLDRIAEEQRTRAAGQQDFENSLRTRQLDLQEGLRRDTLAETMRQHNLADEDRRIGLANTLADQLPPETFLGENDPAVGLLTAGGRKSLLTEAPAIEAQPLFEGPTKTGTTEDVNKGRAKGYIKGASAKQRDTEADNQRQADMLERERKADEERARHDLVMETKQPTGGAPHYQLVPEVDPKTGAQTGRMLGYNSKTNSFEPIQGTTPAGTKAAPGAVQATQHEQSKKEALDSLDQLDQSINAASALIGPGPGRVSHLEQLVGNPDPRISALGTKLLLTKMRVDHAATGTVRAGASPQLLARWDNLLSQNLDAANLKAAVQAMREIIGGQAVQPAGVSKIKSITEIK